MMNDNKQANAHDKLSYIYLCCPKGKPNNITSIHDSCYASENTSARKNDLGILVTEMKRERPKSRPTVDDVKARVCRIYTSDNTSVFLI